jgi:arginase
VPRAWGAGGDVMADAAALALEYPEALVVAEETLEAQSAALARGIPTRPLVLGGCCCAHVGAIRGLAGRYERLAVVWLDAHGDLNTPDSSPSGNLWGMPLRMAIDEGSVRAVDIALVGARDLDPPEETYVADQGIDDDLERALDGTQAVYIALDVDVLEPGIVPSFMPVPGGPNAVEVEAVLRDVASRVQVAGLGITGFGADAEPADVASYVAAAGF